MRAAKDYLMVLVKGITMGAADVIPGVSGGTIAFITGIYEELVNSIKSVDGTALKMLLKLQFRAFWKHINGNFLLAVVGGILISIFSLAKLMQYLLHTYPIYVWSFFFGLIIASTILVIRTVKKWDVKTVVALICGGVAAYMITVLSPASTPNTWWFIILSGAIAICAMILPGISGAFILLLLGKYEYIITAVSNLDIGILLLFAVGAVSGIIAFSHLLSWLLEKYHGMTVALLAGFMVGSLNKIWPWKEPLATYVDSHGVTQAITEKNVLPGAYEQHFNEPALLGGAIGFMVFGFVLIWGIEKIAAMVAKKREAAQPE